MEQSVIHPDADAGTQHRDDEGADAAGGMDADEAEQELTHKAAQNAQHDVAAGGSLGAHEAGTLNYDCRTSWLRGNIVQQPRTVREGEGWAEKIVGECDMLYFSLRRLEFEKSIEDDTNGKFHVLVLVDGEHVRIRSVEHPERYFDAEYMDMVVVPADMGRYVIENLRTEPICVHKTMLKDGFDKE